MTRLATALAGFLMGACLIAFPANAEDSDLREAVQDVLERHHQTYAFPGATVAFVLKGGAVETFAVGLADVETGTAMRPESRMLAASIGKTLWGALVLSLEAEGRLHRSDPVSDHLGHVPWYARVPNADAITVGQLLTHSAGFPDHVHMDGVARALVAMGDAQTFDPADLVGFILDQPPLFEPGQGWAYSDTGYVLLGLVLEAATGRGVFELAKDKFLDPLGLSATGASDGPVLADLAVGYTGTETPFGLLPRTMDRTGRLTWNPAVEWAGGGFVSNAADLARWGHALFSGQAMEGAYLDRLLEGVPVHPDAPGVFYGAGVAIYRDTPHGPVYGHGGWIPGYVSSLRHYAAHGLTIAFQINTDVGIADDRTDLVPALEAALAEALIARSGR